MSVLDFAERVAREAAARALSYYRERESLAVAREQPLDLVTAADPATVTYEFFSTNDCTRKQPRHHE